MERKGHLRWRFDPWAFQDPKGYLRGEQGIPVSATSSEGWRYRARVAPQGGRFVLTELSILAPEGQLPRGGLNTEEIRSVSTLDVLAAVRTTDLSDEDWERLVAVAEEMLTEMSLDELRVIGEVNILYRAGIASMNTLGGRLELTRNPQTPGPMLTLSGEEIARLSKTRRKRQGRALGRDHYARVAINHLRFLRTDPGRPNAAHADAIKALDPRSRYTAKTVATWVSIADERYGFLTGREQGRSGAEPTEALFEWAEAHEDDDKARWLLETHGRSRKGKR